MVGGAIIVVLNHDSSVVISAFKVRKLLIGNFAYIL